MNEKLFVKGKTDEERFKSIEQTFKHFSKRLHKTMVGVIPPIPLFGFVDIPDPETGLVMAQGPFPFNGMITRGVLIVEHYEGKESVKFTINMIGLKAQRSVSFDTRKQVIIEQLNLPIELGDRLNLIVDQPDRVMAIWASILCVVPMAETQQEKYLIEEVSRVAEEEHNALY